MGEMRNVHRVLVRKPEGKRRLGGHTIRWRDNIKSGFEDVNMIYLTQDKTGFM
jgi:hypothetical protein